MTYSDQYGHVPLGVRAELREVESGGIPVDRDAERELREAFDGEHVVRPERPADFTQRIAFALFAPTIHRLTYQPIDEVLSLR